MLLLSALLVAGATQVGAVVGGPPSPAPVGQDGPVDTITSPGGPLGAVSAGRDRLDRAIGTWSANLAANARDFLSATNLGLLYEARARLSGDVSDYERANQALDRALAIEPGHLPAQLARARVLLANHDFAAALDGARAIEDAAPDQPAVLALIADAQLALGDIDAAERIFIRLTEVVPGPPVSARLAQVAFLRGHSGQALELAERAFFGAEAAGLAGPSLSWYAQFCATIAGATGQPETALRWSDRALGLWPQSYVASAVRGRVLARMGRVDEAIMWYERSAAIVPQPATLAGLGDLYAVRGDDDAAAAQYAAVEALIQLAATGEQVYAREFVHFLVDHGRDPAAALEMAEAELRLRRDIYAHDAVAWALMANDRAREADEMMARALALGTADAMLYYHAGVIARSVGDDARARQLLTSALSQPAALDPLAARRARAELDALP